MQCYQLQLQTKTPNDKISYSAVRCRRSRRTSSSSYSTSKYHWKEEQAKALRCELRMHLVCSSKDHTLSKYCSAAFNLVLMNFALSSSSQLKTELDAVAKADVRYSCIFASHLQWTLLQNLLEIFPGNIRICSYWETRYDLLDYARWKSQQFQTPFSRTFKQN